MQVVFCPWVQASQIKLGLLLLKTTPITNQDKGQSHVAPCNSFYGCTLKAHLPIDHSINANSTCTLDAEKGAQIEIRDVPPKFQVNQDVRVKVDPHTKWMAGIFTMTSTFLGSGFNPWLLITLP